jgi:hypothetical protein
MSKDFIESRMNAESLVKARRQQEQLLYLSESNVQDNFSDEYVTQWAQRKYATSDHFLNYVKSLFKTENFLFFYKYLRFPLPSSELINNRIKIELERVMHSEDSFFNYNIRGKQFNEVDIVNLDGLNDRILELLLFRYNDVLVFDLDVKGNPITHEIDIKDIVSINSINGKINQIAYSAKTNINGESVLGFLYVDDKSYCFYNADLSVEILNVPHDLGYCPATYVSQKAFNTKDDAIRLSLLSYVRSHLEEYNFLKTLLRMQEPNGVMPITVTFDTDKKENNPKKVAPGTPLNLKEIAGQSPEIIEEVTGSSTSGVMQAGSVFKLPLRRNSEGYIDTDFAEKFLTFFYIPVEPLEYINKRIQEIEAHIIKSVVGLISSYNGSAKNELQVESEYTDKEDRLRSVSINLSGLRKFADRTKLGLYYGINSIENEAFYGSKFFLESVSSLYNQLKESPNAIESKTILNKLSRIRNKFNAKKADRDSILYSIIPYLKNEDFQTALDANQALPETILLQTRFDYWITQFESLYDDLVDFWDDLGDQMSDSQKTMLINNLIMIEVKKAIVPTNNSSSNN